MTAAAVAAAKKGDIRVEELKDGRIKGQGTGGAGEAGRERPGQLKLCCNMDQFCLNSSSAPAAAMQATLPIYYL